MLIDKIPEKVLVFDTETTGLLNFKKPNSHASQPVVIQLGATLFHRQEDRTYKRVGALYTLLEDQGVQIGLKAHEVHGITAKMCASYGMSPDNALWSFLDMCFVADMVVAHNLSFDIRTVLCTAARAGCGFTENDLFPKEKQFCTMLKSTNIVKAAKANGGIKWPSLEECTQFFFNESLGDDAHDADVDVDGCARVFFELLRRMEA